MHQEKERPQLYPRSLGRIHSAQGWQCSHCIHITGKVGTLQLTSRPWRVTEVSWNITNFEPLIVGLYLPLCWHSPWSLKGTPLLAWVERDLRALPSSSPRWGRVILQELSLQVRALDGMSPGLVWPLLQGDWFKRNPCGRTNRWRRMSQPRGSRLHAIPAG